MTEILTESFCERCGTRYTFETVQPKGRGLGAIGTLGRGLRNFVMTSDSSFDEAMAQARSENDQRATAAQLEAFHRTFNFCLSCRQYTCAECWNAVEGRCLTCAPLPEAEIVQPAAFAFPAASTIDAAPPPYIAPTIATTLPVDVPPITELEPEAPAAPPVEAEPPEGAVFEPEALPEEPEPEAVAPEPEPELEAIAFEPEVVAPEPEPEPEPMAVETELAPEVVAPEPEPEPRAPEPMAVETEQPEAAQPAAAAAPPATGRVALPEFLPGRSLDDEIAAYELRVAALAETPPEALPRVVVEATPPPAAVRAEAAPRAIPVVQPSIEPTPPTIAAPGTCRSCGLSISASARFCRRCGTAQVA